MNINCTESCSYQQEGKCGLGSLSNLLDLSYSGSMAAAPAGNSCPYYRA